MKIISICNQKGGVGKTTTAMNLGAALVKRGKKILCVDLDTQGSLSEYLRHKKNTTPTVGSLMQDATTEEYVDLSSAICVSDEGINYIASDARLSSVEMILTGVRFNEQILSRVLSSPNFHYYDYVLIDCLPSLGLLLTNALIASDSIIITVQAQQFALDGLDDLLNVYNLIKRRGNPRLHTDGILVTMTDNTTVSKLVDANLRERFGAQVFNTTISRRVEAIESTVERRSLLSTANSHLGAQYLSVADELLMRHGVSVGLSQAVIKHPVRELA